MWSIAMGLGLTLLLGGISWFWLAGAGKGLILVAVGWVILGGSAFLRFIQRLRQKR